jgi:hypothetical protein
VSDERLIEIVAKTKSGGVMPFKVLQIISIDGKPYGDPSDVQAIRDFVNHLAGRVSTCETVLRIGETNG